MSKMGSHCSFGHLKHKLRPKERAGVKTGSQIANLTPDQKKSGIDPIYLAAGDVPHIVGKLSTRATTLLQTTSRSEVCSQSYAASKSWESWLAQFRESHAGVPGQKGHFDVGPVERCIVYYREYGGGILPSPGRGESCVSKCPWLVPTPKGVPNAKLTSCGWFLGADSHKLS
jgi:hypothetical protein